MAVPERRPLLLSFLPPERVAQLPVYPRPVDQLVSDLRRLARMRVLPDGRLALAHWLDRAALLSSGHTASRSFTRLASRLDVGRPASVDANPLDVIREVDLLLDAIPQAVEAGQVAPSAPQRHPDLVPIPKPSSTRDKAGACLWVARTPVTRGQYAAVTGVRHGSGADDELPMTHVSWDDAVAYCRLLSDRASRAGYFRLPTAEEWGHAARATTQTAFWSGEHHPTSDICWSDEVSGGRLRPVGRSRPNPWGLHDIHGLVWEWCADAPRAAPDDPTSRGVRYRIIRGGSAFDRAERARLDSIEQWPAHESDEGIGLRTIWSPTEADVPT